MSEQKNSIRIALFVGIILMLIKFAAYLLTHSNAVLTDALESIVNVVASGFAFFSIHLAAKPKDLNHPYGHGKVEFFSVFLEGGLIVIAGILIVGKALYSIFFPTQLDHLLEGTVLLAFTAIVNGWMGYHLRRKGKKFKSMVLEADGKHLLTDVYSTVGLIVGLILIYWTGWNWLDLVISGGLGLYIGFHGYQLLRKSIGGLMDESDAELVEQIAEVLQQNRQDNWIDVHNLRVQRYGSQLHIDAHVTLPYYYALKEVHDEVTHLELMLEKELQVQTEFFFHTDPCVPACCHYCQVTACPVRQAAFDTLIAWDTINLSTNQKHFSSPTLP
jgi:cation diffusion facilitator family transporter